MKNKVWITGSNGMVGKSLLNHLSNNSEYSLVKTTRNDFDQTNQKAVNNWFELNKPEYVIITSALVGGIQYNKSHQAEFLYQNSMILLNILNASVKFNSTKVVFLGASCMYPVNAAQPFIEDSIMSGSVEPTNEGYAISKILGLKYIQMINNQFKKDFISIIPAASYGPNDSYDNSKNHVIPALIKKMHEAKSKKKKEIILWGSGNAKREFLYVDDMAEGIIYILRNYKSCEPINLGTGKEISIKDLATLISKVVGYKGKINFDTTKPDGIDRKILNSSKVNSLGWYPKISLEDGIKKTYDDYLLNL